MHTKDELLKIKWESAIRLENALYKLKKIKARYFKIYLIDLPNLPKDHPLTIKITEEMDRLYQDIATGEEELNQLGKDVEKLHKLIHTYRNAIE